MSKKSFSQVPIHDYIVYKYIIIFYVFMICSCVYEKRAVYRRWLHNLLADRRWRTDLTDLAALTLRLFRFIGWGLQCIYKYICKNLWNDVVRFATRAELHNGRAGSSSSGRGDCSEKRGERLGEKEKKRERERNAYAPLIERIPREDWPRVHRRRFAMYKRGRRSRSPNRAEIHIVYLHNI